MHETDPETSGGSATCSDVNDAKELADAAEKPLGVSDIIEMQKNYVEMMKKYGILYARPEKKLITTSGTFP